MDITGTTTRVFRATPLPLRRADTSRRHYLDTYAKTRSNHASTVESVSTQPIKNARKAIMQDVVQINTAPSVPQDLAVENTSFEYHHQLHDPKNYLQTLIKRHQAAVNDAPDALETTITPSLATETSRLFQDITTTPSQASTLQANLRVFENTNLLGSTSAKASPIVKSVSTAHIQAIVAGLAALFVMTTAVFSFSGRVSSQAVLAQPATNQTVIEIELPRQQPNASSKQNLPGSTNQVAYAAQPVQISINGINLNSSLERLGLTSDGMLSVPTVPGIAGWFEGSSAPGVKGTSVIIGAQTDNRGGVFDSLDLVKNGDILSVVNRAGERFKYRVEKTASYTNDKQLIKDVFKKTSKSQLALITSHSKWLVADQNERLLVVAQRLN